MFGSDSLSGLNLRLRFKASSRRRQRRADRRLQVATEVFRLEERWMLSLPGNQSPPDQFPPDQVTANKNTPLSDILWNGGPPLLGAPGMPGRPSFPSPSQDKAMKTVTLTNNGPATIYPFIRGQNNGKDGASTTGNLYYDPQDPVNTKEYREYIGYSNSAGTFMGLPSKASITFQVPLVLWDGENVFLATDPADLNSSSQVYSYDSSAKIYIATYTGKKSTEWVTADSNYPKDDTPVVVLYRSNTPKGPSDAAPAQLLEWTFRDPYLLHFINDLQQTKVLMNYDVSYVNKLTAPVAMEAAGVPITLGDQISKTKPPEYFGSQDYGWNPTTNDTKTFAANLANFVKNGANNTKEVLGNYFSGKGWPEYYNPDANDIVIPSGANIYQESPLTDQRSPYDQNRYLISSNSNNGPVKISLGGALPDGTNILKFAPPQPVMTLFDQLVTAMDVLNTGNSNLIKAGTTITKLGMMNGRPYIELSQATGTGDNPNGYTLDFKTPLNDYAVTDITRLWYSWASYYVNQVFNHYPNEVPASAVYKPPTNTALPQNEITLTSVPAKPLLVGMTVKGEGDRGGIRPGTTILSITNSHGEPIGSADQIGDKIYLSLLPVSGKIPPSQPQPYTFGKPTPIPYSGEAKPYSLTFTTDAQKAKAKLFAGSVYAAMSAEAGVPDPPETKLPKSADVVGRVIQFYANLPTDPLPGGKNLTGQVRDVVKSILRGVWNFTAVPNQKEWYPDPTDTKDGGGQKFNVYNLDPYVWFVHTVEDTAGYAFSVDDDVSNPSAPGPILAPKSTTVYNHFPDNLQIGFGGITGFGNKNPWFPTLRWGEIDTTATVTEYKGKALVTFKGNLTHDEYLKLFYQIFPPGPGEVGAYVSAPGYLKPDSSVIEIGPNGLDNPQLVLSLPPQKLTDRPIPIRITGLPA
jgi:hypothetical protein